MSMIGNFLLLSDTRLAELLAVPELVHDACDAGYEAGSEAFVDVDKAWHCIHFLLTGTAEGGEPPLDFVMTGGHPVGDEDVGYGPARAILPDELRELAAALAPVDRAALANRFEPALMDELQIYPDAGHWSEVDPSSDDSFGYYLAGFDAIKALVQRGVTSGSGMLVWLS